MNGEYNEYKEGLRYYRFMFNYDRCNRSTRDGLFNRIYVPKKIEDLI